MSFDQYSSMFKSTLSSNETIDCIFSSHKYLFYAYFDKTSAIMILILCVYIRIQIQNYVCIVWKQNLYNCCNLFFYALPTLKLVESPLGFSMSPLAHIVPPYVLKYKDWKWKMNGSIRSLKIKQEYKIKSLIIKTWLPITSKSIG